MAINNAQDLFNAYMAVINPSVIEKVDTDSIDPVDVGGIALGLQAFIPLWKTINLQDITQDDPAPIDADGADGDDYWQNLINGFKIWRKENGAWVVKITINNSLNVPDGVVSGLRSFISGNVVTVESGGWVIANVIYRKDTQTQFTLSAANANWGRYDLIYADDSNAVLLLEGTASASPVIPTLPADSILVDVAFIPSVASGNSPYLLYGNDTDANTDIYFTDNSQTGIVCDKTAGTITLADIATNFPTISTNGIIRGAFDLLIGGTWYASDVLPEMTKDGSGNLLTALFTLGNTGITTIRGRIF